MSNGLNMSPTGRVGSISLQVEASSTTMIMVHTTGMVKGGRLGTQWFKLRTQMNGMPSEGGGYELKGHAGVSTVSLLDMYPVLKGTHDVALLSEVRSPSLTLINRGTDRNPNGAQR